MNNPYAKNLGDRDPLSVLETTVDRIGELTAGLSTEQLNAPIAPGKWSIHEIVAHLADLELVTSARCRWILFEDNPKLIGYDQDPWVNGWRREEESFAETFQRLRILRNAQLRMFRKCSVADLERPATHGDLGPINLGLLRSLVAGHDLNHLTQLEKLATE
ncbi:MAG: DinB family protein [Bryobacteraceae bacterium]